MSPLDAALYAWLTLLPMNPAAPTQGNEVFCLAQNVYYEARGEESEGKLAVAHVTMNRVGAKGYKPTVCGVVLQEGQFSWTDWPPKNVKFDPAAWQASVIAAAFVYNGLHSDNTGGALFFCNPKKATRSWCKRTAANAKVIGNHNFVIALADTSERAYVSSPDRRSMSLSDSKR